MIDSTMSSPYNIPETLQCDAHYRAREYWDEIEHTATGRLTYTGAPFRMAEGDLRIRRPAPLLGQHNEEIYGGLGFSK
jgi:crotonobetainyl-CoA:carnitine CoA-transferase CaiB-like acyl-CoA transferase